MFNLSKFLTHILDWCRRRGLRERDKTQLLQQQFGRPVVFVDFETTGTDPTSDRAIEVAGARYDHGGRLEFRYLINPGIAVPPTIQTITGINDADLRTARTTRDVFFELEAFLEDSPILVAHNAIFDIAVLVTEQRRCGLPTWQGDFICTRTLATFLGVGMPGTNRAGQPYTSYKLGDVLRALGLELSGAHRAGQDVGAVETVFFALYPKAKARQIPVINAVAHPAWAPIPRYLPERAKVHMVR